MGKALETVWWDSRLAVLMVSLRVLRWVGRWDIEMVVDWVGR